MNQIDLLFLGLVAIFPISLTAVRCCRSLIFV